MQSLYSDGKVPRQGEPGYKHYEIILLMRYAAETDNFKDVDGISIPPKIDFDQCSLVAAIHLVEHDSI